MDDNIDSKWLRYFNLTAKGKLVVLDEFLNFVNGVFKVEDKRMWSNGGSIDHGKVWVYIVVEVGITSRNKELPKEGIVFNTCLHCIRGWAVDRPSCGAFPLEDIGLMFMSP